MLATFHDDAEFSKDLSRYEIWMEHVVAHFVEVLRYKSEGCGFHIRWAF